MERLIVQGVTFSIWVFSVAHSNQAVSSSLNCEKQADFLNCTCLFKDFYNCTMELFAYQNFSGISKFYINCDDGNLSLTNFTKLAQEIMLVDLTIVRCELTDWHKTKVLPAALRNVANLAIMQSFSANIFPNFGALFVNLQRFTFYDNYFHLNRHYIYVEHEYSIPYVQLFSFQFENAVVCINQSTATEKIATSNDVKFPNYKYSHSCFCTFDKNSVQLYCFGGYILDLKRALNAVASMPQYTNPTENRTIISAINLHNLQFLVHDCPDSKFGAILNETVPATDLADLRSSATHPFMFQLHTCEPTNATGAWKELQELLCPLYELTEYATTFSVVKCPDATGLMLTDRSDMTPANQTCPLLRLPDMDSLQYLDLSNNNITMEQYLAIFHYQSQSQCITVFNFSGNFLGILELTLFYRINPYNLRHVDLSFSHLTAVQDNPFEYLSRVEWLSLAGNHLRYVQHYWFRDLRNLKHLDLSRNRYLSGVWGPGKTYPQIWPESLEHLDLSFTNLVDADDDLLVGMNGQRFTDKFFMGLSNLLVLNLSYAAPALSVELFRPLRSLQILDLRHNWRFLKNPSATIPKDLLQYLGNLRALYMAEVLPRNNEVYNAPCQFFIHTAMLHTLELTQVYFGGPNTASKDQPPKCVDLLNLYNWVLWKRRGTAKFTFLADLKCTFNGTAYCSRDMQALLANNSRDFNLSMTFGERSQLTGAVTTPIHIIGGPDPASLQPSQWTQIQIPLFVCLAIIFLVLLMCIPTRALQPALLQKKHNSDNLRNPQFELGKFDMNNFGGRRKELKQMFFQETLINGFLFAYSSKMVVEKFVWYAIILSFTGIFISQTIDLWIQFYYTNPNTQSTMISAAKVPQNSFTICFPVRKRNRFELTTSDIYTLFEKPICDQNIDLSLPLRNAMLRDMFRFRIGAQMAWEGGTLSQNLTITEAMHVMDHIVFERNLSYRQLLTEINGVLCDVMQFTASMKSLDSRENGQITLNPAGCSHLLQKQGFGLTWYDWIENDTACIRFPGLFNFSGFQNEGIFQFRTWQFFYNATSAKIDLGGHEYPLAAGQNAYPAHAYMHHDTFMVLHLRGVFKNLETYRSKTNRCHKNCVGTKRVREIQTQCKCRPLMFADLSDPTLPDCTLDRYENCGLSRNGDLKDCAETVPCELWDYGVQTTDNGLTSDNSTIIRFGGMNTLYVMYEEQVARSLINFLGDVGGVFGLWLGGNMVAVIHIFIFCLKSIYVLVPKYGSIGMHYKVGNPASVCKETE